MKEDVDLKDCMNLGNDNSIAECVKFSCKINLKGTSALNQYHKITIVITNKKIYSARKKKVKPLIQIEDITAFTISNDVKNKHFIIHVKNSMDELFYGEYIMHILDVIKHVFYQQN